MLTYLALASRFNLLNGNTVHYNTVDCSIPCSLDLPSKGNFCQKINSSTNQMESCQDADTHFTLVVWLHRMP